MKKWLFTLVLLVFPGAPANAAPIVTLGPPVTGEFLTLDPGSIRIEMLGAGDFVDLQLSMTIHPFCIRPIETGLTTTGDGGTFSNQTGVLVNGCGGDTSVFNIRLTGDGLTHTFDIEFIDLENGSLLISIAVQLYPGTAPVVTLGPPVTGEFLTVDPGSIRVEMLGAGNFVDLPLSMTIHPFCIRPIETGLGTTGDGGTFSNQTGVLVNGCGGDTSVFDIRLTGDGLTHTFQIEFIDLENGIPLAAIPVELFPATLDSDSDGIPDLSDNCVQVANADQRDTDADGIGNICDADVSQPDNDCIVNFRDLLQYRANFFQQGDFDTDNNGDNITNFLDLLLVRTQFFGPPGPSAAGCDTLPIAWSRLGHHN